MKIARQFPYDLFKSTEIGDIPAGWDVVTLGEVGKLTDGDWILKKFYTKSGVRLLQVGDVGIGKFMDKSNRFISMESAIELKCTFTDPQNILISRMPEPIGRACFAPNLSYPAITAVDVSILTPKSCLIDSHYLVHILNSPLNFQQCSRLASGATRQRISRKNLETILLPLPPLDEQRKIAHILNTVQRAIAAQDDLIAAAQELKRSLMRRLFTAGPGPEPAPTKEVQFGDVPQHWNIVPLNECAYVQTGTAKGRKFGNEPTVELPYLRVANVQDGYLDLSEIKSIRIKKSEVDRYRLQVGDVVLTEGGDFDKLGRGFIWRGQIKDCIHQNHVFAVRANREILSPEYLAYLVQSEYGKAYFLTVAHRTTNLASINTTKLKGLPVPIPLFDEQAAIVKTLQTADAKIAAEQDRKAALQQLFNSLLQALMTGRLRVNQLVF